MSIFKKLFVNKKHANLLSVYDPPFGKVFACLWFNFSHLKERKFRHGFADTINLMSACEADVLEPQNTFYCFVTFTQRKDINSSIILRKLAQSLKIWVVKIKSHLCYVVEKQILLKL